MARNSARVNNKLPAGSSGHAPYPYNRIGAYLVDFTIDGKDAVPELKKFVNITFVANVFEQESPEENCVARVLNALLKLAATKTSTQLICESWSVTLTPAPNSPVKTTLFLGVVNDSPYLMSTEAGLIVLPLNISALSKMQREDIFEVLTTQEILKAGSRVLTKASITHALRLGSSWFSEEERQSRDFLQEVIKNYFYEEEDGSLTAAVFAWEPPGLIKQDIHRPNLEILSAGYLYAP